MKTIDHYTVSTGDLRKSPRSEVGAPAIEMCSAMLTPGVHEISGFGCELRVIRDRADEFRAEVTCEGDVLVTVWVCSTSVALQRVLASTGARGGDVSAPACVALPGPGLASHVDHASWLGDFERCLAWAWLERVRT